MVVFGVMTLTALVLGRLFCGWSGSHGWLLLSSWPWGRAGSNASMSVPSTSSVTTSAGLAPRTTSSQGNR